MAIQIRNPELADLLLPDMIGAAGPDPNAIHVNVAGEIAGIAAKAVPVAADLVVIEDSAAANAKKSVQVGNLPGGVDPNAIHVNVAAEIAGIAAKAVPIATDLIVIEDSAAANAKKSVQVGNLPGGVDPNAIHDNVAGEIAAIAAKAVPVNADLLVIEDSAAANAKKSIQIGNLPDTTVGVRVYRSIAQVIPNNVTTSIIFDTQRWDDPNNNQWAVAPNPTRLTCQFDGIYTIAANAIFDSHAAGVRWLFIVLNGVTQIAAVTVINLSANWAAMAVTTTYKLSIGDFLEMDVYQNRGGNLNILAQVARSPEFSMVRCM